MAPQPPARQVPVLETAQACDDLKDLKVRIPSRQIMQLHAIKLLTGRPMSDVLTAALGEYFRDEGLLPETPR